MNNRYVLRKAFDSEIDNTNNLTQDGGYYGYPVYYGDYESYDDEDDRFIDGGKFFVKIDDVYYTNDYLYHDTRRRKAKHQMQIDASKAIEWYIKDLRKGV